MEGPGPRRRRVDGPGRKKAGVPVACRNRRRARCRALRVTTGPGTTTLPLRPHHFDGLRRARVSSSFPKSLGPLGDASCMAVSFALDALPLSSCNQHSDILRTAATSMLAVESREVVPFQSVQSLVPSFYHIQFAEIFCIIFIFI